MERQSGLWIASTPARAWVLQGRPITATRMADINLYLDGTQKQVWEGFGGGGSEIGWETLALLKGVDRQRALNALFKPDSGCNLHYSRVSVGASNLSVGPYSLNEIPGDLLMKRLSVDRDRDRIYGLPVPARA